MALNISDVKWGLDIRDAGPPASLSFYGGWICATGLAYLLFTVIRPLVTDKDRSTSGHSHPSARKSTWLPSQLFFTTWAWCLLDCVHRTYCYVCLSPTMLWRRGLLPLAPQWSRGLWSVWVNHVRFMMHCRGLWPGAPTAASSPRCRAHQLPTGSLQDEERGASGKQDGDRVDMYATVLPPFQSTEEKVETQQYRLLALYAVLTTSAILIVVASQARRVQQTARGWKRGRGDTQKEDRRDDASVTPTAASEEPLGTGHALAVDAGTDETAAASKFMTAHSKFYVKGADDAWLNSAAAEEEYARWEQLSRSAADTHDGTLHAPLSRMHQVLVDIWPTLIAVCYGGLYAATGAMPLLGLLLFPAVSIVAIGSALYCSLD